MEYEKVEIEKWRCLFLQVIASGVRQNGRFCPVLSSHNVGELAALCVQRSMVFILLFYLRFIVVEDDNSEIVTREFLLQLIELEPNLDASSLTDQVGSLIMSD